MANLVIDIGNSLIKVAVFKNGIPVKVEHYTNIDSQQLKQLISANGITRAIIASVKKNREGWESDLTTAIPTVYFTRDMAGPVKNHYATPQTLGPDRLAAVMGAYYLYPQTDTLVIDAGTCITYDYLDAGGNYYGGSISPGLHMRYKALNHYTSTLPLINTDEQFNREFGNDTISALQSGVQNGIKHELTGFIEIYRLNQPELNIILTGGDGIFFDTLLKNSIFAPYIKNEPYLVLKGLNAAIQYHND